MENVVKNEKKLKQIEKGRRKNEKGKEEMTNIRGKRTKKKLRTFFSL